MKICVMGAGGLGGFFGAWLADAGEDVSFIARGEHLRAMQANGLEVRSPLGNKLIRPVAASDDPASVGPVDVILFCVKTYDLDAAAARCRSMLKDDTAVISLLNGIEAPERLGQALGMAHAVPGVTYVPANIVAPGVIEHKGNAAGLTFGEIDGTESTRLVAFRDACRKAGLDGRLVNDINLHLWTKFVAWAAASGTCAASRQNFGGLQRIPELKELFATIHAEGIAVGRAKQIPLAEDIAETTLVAIDQMPPGASNSTLVDLENGKRLELEAGVGSVLRQGAQLGIETPASKAIYAALKPFIDGRPSRA